MFLLALTQLLGCSGSGYEYAGLTTHDYVALDNDRSWEYASDDPDRTWILQVDKVFPVEEFDGTEVVTLEYAKKDPYELLHSIQWSSDSQRGVLIHGWSVEGGASAAYPEAPIQFADRTMLIGDSVQTDAAGTVFTSTLVAVENCDNHWTPDEWECLHFQVDDGQGGASGAPFVGDWWMAKGWGASWLQGATDTDKWILSSGKWEPLEG
jgi:hypothetical protein